MLRSKRPRRPTALAIASANCYSARMSSKKIRRVPAFLAALVLAVGLIAHGVGGPDITVKSAMTTASDMSMPSGMPMPGKCNSCAGNEKGVAPAVCAAFCSAVIALPVAPVVLHAVPAETLSPTHESDASGFADPPDPHPPRSSILS